MPSTPRVAVHPTSGTVRPPIVKADGLANRKGPAGVGHADSPDDRPGSSPPPVKRARVWEAPGVLLVGWCLLVAALILVRHVHASLVPVASPYEFAPAYGFGGSDAQILIIGLIGAAVLAAAWWSTR